MNGGYSNSVRNVPIRKFVWYGFALAVCGAVSMVAGTIASLVEAEKSYHMESYTNTHWITTVYLYAGAAVLLLEKFKRNFLLYFSLALCLVSCAIGIGAGLADLINVVLIAGADWKVQKAGHWAYLSHGQLYAMLFYALLDLITSTAAVLTSVLVLWEIRSLATRYFQPVKFLVVITVVRTTASLKIAEVVFELDTQQLHNCIGICDSICILSLFTVSTFYYQNWHLNYLNLRGAVCVFLFIIYTRTFIAFFCEAVALIHRCCLPRSGPPYC